MDVKVESEGIALRTLGNLVVHVNERTQLKVRVSKRVKANMRKVCARSQSGSSRRVSMWAGFTYTCHR